MSKMDKETEISQYKDFNRATKLFIRELIANFPHIKEFKKMHLLYKIMKTVSKKSPSKYFYNMVVKDYADDLMNKNFDVFLSDEFDDPTVEAGIFATLKNEFRNLDDANRDAIWMHLVLLVTLCKKAMNIAS